MGEGTFHENIRKTPQGSKHPHILKHFLSNLSPFIIIESEILGSGPSMINSLGSIRRNGKVQGQKSRHSTQTILKHGVSHQNS